MDKINMPQQGSLRVSEDVIATIARMATCDIEGVDRLVKPKASFRQMFIKPDKNDSIKIKFAGDVVEITIGIFARFGHKVIDVAENIQTRVKSDIQNMTGVTVSRVNVTIAGIVFDKNKKD